MPEILTLIVEGRAVQVPAGASVLAALQAAGVMTLRNSLSGQPRGALCGMGSCFECRALVNGALVRTCLTPARPDMQVKRAGSEHVR